MNREELLRRLDAAQVELREKGERVSDASLSRDVTGNVNYVRDLRRHRQSKTDSQKLMALAQALRKPRFYFMDENSIPDSRSPDDRDRVRLAFRLADVQAANYKGPNPDVFRADLATLIYQILNENAAAGYEIPEEAAFHLIGALISRLPPRAV